MTGVVKVTLYDQWQNLAAGVGAVSSLTCDWRWDLTPGTGTLVVPGTPEWVGTALSIDKAGALPVRIEAARLWTGRVARPRYADDGDGPRLELTMVDDNLWLQHIWARQVPLGGPTEQGGAEEDVRTGPAETVAKAVVADAAARLGLPLTVVPAPADDTSATVTVRARMTRLDQLLEPALRAAGLSLRCWTWRPGDPVPPGLPGAPDGPRLLVDCQRPQDNPHLVWQQQVLAGFSVGATPTTGRRALVGGAGQGRDRAYTEVERDGWDLDLGPWLLPEVYVDAPSGSGEEVPVADAAAGRDALAKATGARTASFSAPDAMPWRFGTDWDVGHHAYARIAGVDVKAQILRATLTVDGDGTSYSAEVGDLAQTPDQKIVSAIAAIAAGQARDRARR